MTTDKGTDALPHEPETAFSPAGYAKLETRVSAIESTIKELAGTVARFIERQDGNRPDVYKMAGVASVALVLAGAYFTLAKTNIDDHNTFTNEKIAATNLAVQSLATSVDKFGDKIDKRFERIADQTIPKEELNARFTQVQKVQDGKADRAVVEKAGEQRDDQIKGLREDVGRLRSDTVRREEIMSQIAAIVASNKATQEQVNDFQRKFVAIPSFPKFNDK